MARQEADREDLFAELSSYENRWEIAVPEMEELVVIGLRNDGKLSCYFGPDRVYHFDPLNRLRRAFVNGLLYRTQGTTLAQLKRVRTESKSELHRRDFNETECGELLSEMQSTVREFWKALTNENVETIREHCTPDGKQQVQNRLTQIANTPPELAPTIKGRR